MSDTPRTDAFEARQNASRDRYDFAVLLGELFEFARKLERETTHLRRDKNRLDWWNGESHYEFGNTCKLVAPGWYWNYGRHEGKRGIPNIRATIDSAMAHSLSGRKRYDVTVDPTGPLLPRIANYKVSRPNL